MKKGALALAGLVMGIVVAVIWSRLAGRSMYTDVPMMQNARLVEAETAWYAAGVSNYRILVSVEFSSEQRWNEITVTGGKVSAARVAVWDMQAGDMGAYVPLSTKEAEYFTVTGLFDLVRSALQNEEVPRDEIRMSTSGTPAVPELIYLSEVIQDGEPVEGTALIVHVLQFEVLP